MNVTLSSDSLMEVAADALVLGLCEGEPPGSDVAIVNRALDGLLSSVAGLDSTEMSGKKGELSVLHTGGKIGARRLVMVGLGKRSEANESTLREASGAAIRRMRDIHAKRVASALHRSIDSGTAESRAAAVIEGSVRGLWEPDSYRAESDRAGDVDHLIVVEPDTKGASAVQTGIARGRILGESANLARDLVNEPANELLPAALAERARALASEVGLGCEVLDEDAMFRLGMGALLAVSVGSENRARMVVLRHTPNPGAPELALVGKGITFDTGGISLKVKDGMEAMKGDMAGAAAVIGALRAIALLKVPVNVVGVAPCAENMPSGKAFRPGDVFRCMNGRTVEIISTDAEGRMVLADALTYTARNLNARRIVDTATLTGACVVALGRAATGAVTNNPELFQRVRQASESAGERIWELPWYTDYREQIKSDIADMKNSGGREGGALTAAAFLKEFVDDAPWVHLDIAGTSSLEKPMPHQAKGATGVMVRTFVRLAESLAT